MFHFHLALCFPHHFTSYMLKPIFIALSFFQVELILNSEFVLEKKKLLLESSLLKKTKTKHDSKLHMGIELCPISRSQISPC